MKTLIVGFLFLVALAFYSFKDENKERYYFVGYATDGGASGGITFRVESKAEVTYGDLLKIIRVKNKITDDVKISVTGFYEFRNKRQYDAFNDHSPKAIKNIVSDIDYN